MAELRWSDVADVADDRQRHTGLPVGASHQFVPGHCQLVEGSALLPREINAPDRFQQAHITASHSNERAGAEQAVVSRPQEVSTDSEEILHDTVNRREPLELSARLETPHLALPLTRRLVGDLGSIVRVLIMTWTTDGITVRPAAA